MARIGIFMFASRMLLNLKLRDQQHTRMANDSMLIRPSYQEVKIG